MNLVKCLQTYDYWHRVLAYVYLPDGRMLNEVLLKEGVAVMMTVPPNVAYVERFKEIVNGSHPRAEETKAGS